MQSFHHVGTVEVTLFIWSVHRSPDRRLQMLELQRRGLKKASAPGSCQTDRSIHLQRSSRLVVLLRRLRLLLISSTFVGRILGFLGVVLVC